MTDRSIALRDSIGVLLLRNVFGVYILVAALVTALHLYAEYRHQKELAQENLLQAELILKPLFADAMWHLDQALLEKASQGALNFPSVVGVMVLGTEEQALIKYGEISAAHRGFPYRDVDGKPLPQGEVRYEDNLIEHLFMLDDPLNQEAPVIGQVHLYTSPFILLEKVRYAFVLILFNALLKTTALWIVFLWFSQRLLAQPLKRLIDATTHLDLEDTSPQHQIEEHSKKRNELSVLVETYNTMVGRIIQSNQQRRCAEEALRASQQRLHLAIEVAQLGVWDIQLQTRKMIVNEHWARMVGCQIEDLATAPHLWESRLHPEDREAVLKQEQAHLSGAAPTFEVEYRLVRPDGSLCWVAAFGQVVERTEAGEPLRLLGIQIDITERKQAEKELKELYQELSVTHEEMQAAQAQLLQSAKLASLGEMATSIAHELKQPLSTIGVSSDLLLQCLARQDWERAEKQAQRIHSQNEKAIYIIQHLREFGRDSRKDAKQPMDLSALVQGAQELFIGHLRSEQVEVKLELAPALPPVVGDAIQVEQVLTNLILNATDAMRERTERVLTLRTRTVLPEESLWEQAAQQDPPLLPNGRTWVALEVSDTGGGIAEEHLMDIFQSFFTTKPPGEGTGLGLAISRGIAVAHEGALLLENHPGVGVTFTLLLPAS